MGTINNMLFNIRNQAPALLQTGAGKTENSQNLPSLIEQLRGEGQWAGLDSAADRSRDLVTLAYRDIGQKVVSDMAALTAGAIQADPSLDNDYFIALTDTLSGREARVYRRSEILADFEGLEKSILEAQMAANPLQVFGSSKDLPPTSDDPACQDLAAQLNGFLKTNAKTINSLNSAGFDLFQEYQASSALLKALTA